MKRLIPLVLALAVAAPAFPQETGSTATGKKASKIQGSKMKPEIKKGDKKEDKKGGKPVALKKKPPHEK